MATQESEALWERGREILLASPQLPISVDLEADGIAGHGSILQIGAKAITGEVFQSLVAPYSDDFLAGHQEFNAQHGLDRDRLREMAPPHSSVAANLSLWLKGLQEVHGKQLLFVGLNSGYDFSLLDTFFVKAGMENPFGHSSEDIKTLALLLGEQWDWDNTKQSRMPSIILPENGLTHDALQDAEDQERMHLGMVAILDDPRVRQAIRTVIAEHTRAS